MQVVHMQLVAEVQLHAWHTSDPDQIAPVVSVDATPNGASGHTSIADIFGPASDNKHFESARCCDTGPFVVRWHSEKLCLMQD